LNFPGPVGLPILGYLPFLDVMDLGSSFGRLSERFGSSVVSLKAGTAATVVLNTEEAVREAFAKKELCARPDTFMFRFFSRGGRGVASASGEAWEVHRRFVQRHLLRSVGAMARHAASEAADLAEELASKAHRDLLKRGVEIGYEVNVSVVNVIWALVAGKRRPRGCPKLERFLKAVNRGIELASTSSVLLFAPWLLKILPGNLFGLKEMEKMTAEAETFLQEIIDQHKTKSMSDHHGEDSEDEGYSDVEPRDFIEAFLAEMDREEAHESFDEEQLRIVCTEMFGAGAEPTSVTLKWALRFMAKWPEVQEKARLELKACGNNVVHWSDREALPYMRALTQEVIRLSDVHPIGVLHGASADSVVDSRLIPSGSFIFPNFHRIHRDERAWGANANELRPERWMDDHGRFVGSKRKGFVAFGCGPRQCPGREIAQMEVFVFLANLLKRLEFSLVPGDDGSLKGTPGIVMSPKTSVLVIKEISSAH